MPASDSGRDPTPPADQRGRPTSVCHVLGIIDTATEIGCAVDGLVQGAFHESEVELSRGIEEADRGGIAALLAILAQGTGLRRGEAEMTHRYEQALREGSAVLAVATPTEDRKRLAAQILHECGAHFINFFGPLNVERLGR